MTNLSTKIEQATAPSREDSAVISECGRYRYRLERTTAGNGSTCVIMVNPSTADATVNDATIRKLIGFGNRNNWGRLIVGNLFAYRATDVRELGKIEDPVGPENDKHLMRMFCEAARIVVAWGPITKQPKPRRDRWNRVFDMIQCSGHSALAWAGPIEPYCIGPVAKCGHPKHPLMLPYDSPIITWHPPSKQGTQHD